MPKRITGELEKRLLEQVKRRVRREHGAEHGEQVAFADAIKKPESWVSNYLNGNRYPNLDTYILIAEYCEVALPSLKSTPLEERLSAGARRIAMEWEQVPVQKRPALKKLVESYLGIPEIDQKQTEPRAPDRSQGESRTRGRKRGA